MNKSTFFNHCLMKRRYSVPETVMRKHKLQESAAAKKKDTLKMTPTTTTTAKMWADGSVLDNKEEALDVSNNTTSCSVKDESCQTETYHDPSANRLRHTNSCKRTSRLRKRENLRYFKKTNSYCQYKSLSMFHKKMCDESAAAQQHSDPSFLREPLREGDVKSKGRGGMPEELPVLTVAPPSACGDVKKSNSDLAVSVSKRLTPVVRHHSYPPASCNRSPCSAIGSTEDSGLKNLAFHHSYPPASCDRSPCSATGSTDDGSLKNLAFARTVLMRPKIVLASDGDKSGNPPSTHKTLLDLGKSVDQNTSGYNTVCGSLDDTPRHRTPETPKLAGCGGEQPTNGQPAAEENKCGSFPITFHSESVFVHPYQNGFLSHKELHHISIQLVPDEKTESETSHEPKSCFETQVSTGAPQNAGGDASQAATERTRTKIEAVAKTLSNISETSMDKKERVEQTVPLVREPDTPVSGDDCAVPTSHLPLETSPEDVANLKIEIDVPTLDFSKMIHGMPSSTERFLSGMPQRQQDVTASPSTTQQKPAATCNRYPSKAALDYLFQKLGGDAYPKRHLLKQPTFPDYSHQQSSYYSDLFDDERLQVPHKVQFNNQTYDILSGNLLPNERTSTVSTAHRCPPCEHDDATFSRLSHTNGIISGDMRNEALSDSDISIPDSLEDFQQQRQQQQQQQQQQRQQQWRRTKLKCNNNKYNKYDERIARGDVVSYTKSSNKAPDCGTKRGIAYFLPLSETGAPAKSAMPAELKQKLHSRSDRLARHTLCVEAKRRRPPKRGKFCHKQIQTSFNVDLATSEEVTRVGQQKRVASEAQEQLPRGDESDLDERIMDILLKGLKMQETAASAAGPPESRPSEPAGSDTDSSLSPKGQPVIREYVEMYRLTTPATHELSMSPPPLKEHLFSSNDQPTGASDLFEVLHSEEQIGSVNSTNYYTAVKKSRRVYYPQKGATKQTAKGDIISDNDCSATQSSVTIPTFSKYQKKLKEFQHQISRQRFDKINPLSSSSSGGGGNEDNTSSINCPQEAIPQQVRIKRMLRDKHKMKTFNCKIPGIRPNRFRQRFEAIPEEMGANSIEQSELRQESGEGHAQPEAAAHSTQVDENKNVAGDNNQNGDFSQADEEATHQQAPSQRPESEGQMNRDCATEGHDADQQAKYRDELKSQKGRNSLCVVREQEELITLSRGWINFYLLNGNNVEDGETTEQTEDESVALSETSRIPQQYSVHIHAKPQSYENTQTSSLPGLCKTLPGQSTKSGKLKTADKTVLPDISHSNFRKMMNASVKNLRSKNALPKLHPSDESDTSNKADTELISAEPVMATQCWQSLCNDTKFDSLAYAPLPAVQSKQSPLAAGQDTCTKEMPLNGLLTSSVHSESSADEISGRSRVKKLQRYHRPHTYHATRTRNQWSLTIEGNHSASEKQASDIEMQFFVKNKNNGNPNQTWKLSIKNEEASQTQDYNRHHVRNYLPHLNVNYKMLPFPIYHDDSASYSENNSRSNSALSGRNTRGTIKIKDSSSRNLKRFTGDMRLQIRQSEDDLTVTGSAITPERKPKVPTMSERDLYRMKLLRQNVENRTT